MESGLKEHESHADFNPLFISRLPFQSAIRNPHSAIA